MRIVRHPFLLAWAVASVALVGLQHRHTHIPAYHDGRAHFDVAWALHEHLAFPFVETLDTGHPPLVSWILALAWLVPLPRLLVMHALVWTAASAFVAAVFEVGRRAFGAAAGLFAAALLFAHPVFAAQALQLNLDLFHAAFAWLAILSVVTGSPIGAALAMTAAALTKLNGLFTVAALLLWVVVRLVASRDVSRARVLSALGPFALPLLAFGLYHAAKVTLVGHLFATPEFEDANLRFVAGLGEYATRFSHALDQIFGYRNPNRWVLRALGLMGPTALAAVAFGSTRDAAKQLRVEPPSDAPGFYRPLSPVATLALVGTVAALHVALWSFRSYLSLVRYFLLVYPALYLTLAGLVTLAARRGQAALLGAIAVPLSLLFVVQARPTEAARWFPEHTRALLFPPTGVPTNYENSLELVDLGSVLERTAGHIEGLSPRVTRIQARWPFEAYLTDPRHGVVHAPLRFDPETPEVVIETSASHPGASPRDVEPPSGFELEHIERIGRVWMAVFGRPRLD